MHVWSVAKSCPTLCNPMGCILRLLCPWDSPGKNTEVGCHFPSPGDLPDLGIKPVSPGLAGGFFATNIILEGQNKDKIS